MTDSSFLNVAGRRIEYRYFNPEVRRDSRTIVMLHEGLGSVAMWKQFPQRLAATTGARVMAYSRPGYGRSASPAQPYSILELQEKEALAVLPELLGALGIETPVLFGHSDGASIALIYAGTFPDRVSQLVALAPHVFVEDICIASIEQARRAFLETDLPRKLAPYHDDPERAFWTWNNLWLDPGFRSWNIERYLSAIVCPTLAVQGYADEYGTMEQLERIGRAVSGARLLKLAQCGHSPHRDQPELLMSAVLNFLRRPSFPRQRVHRVPRGKSR